MTPACSIVAGPNGAGKTTFALRYLPDVAGVRRFINADAIAAGLSPLAPESEWIHASRIFLREIEESVGRRESFAFETTLAGRTYVDLIRRLNAEGWLVQLFYLWLPDVELAIERVRERVRHGGHAIDEDVIRRRFARSLEHLLNLYAPHCDEVTCFDNSGETPELVFSERSGNLVIHNNDVYAELVGTK